MRQLRRRSRFSLLSPLGSYVVHAAHLADEPLQLEYLQEAADRAHGQTARPAYIIYMYRLVGEVLQERSLRFRCAGGYLLADYRERRLRLDGGEVEFNQDVAHLV